MAKEASTMIRLERVKGLDQGRLKFFQCAGRGPAQMGLEFGEGQLDGIEIGTVRRQVAHLGSTGSDLLADTSHLVGGEIIEDDDVARMQLGTENVLEVSGKNLGIDRALDEERRGDTFPAQGGNKGRTLPVTVRNRAHAALAHG